MRSCIFISSLLLTATLAVGPAFGASFGVEPKRRAPPAQLSDASLRGPLPANLPVISLPPPSVQPLPAPGTAFAGLSAVGLATPPSITPLRPVGDPAPICRAECAETRYLCASTDDLECDTKWSQCVATCSAPTLR